MKNINELPATVDLLDLIPSFLTDVNAAAAALKSGKPRGITTGLPRLDKNFGGYLPPGPHVVQSAPGCGKTAYTLQAASDCQFPALFVSAEMGLLEIFRRLIARQTKTFLGRLKSGEIAGSDAEKLARTTAENLAHLRLMDATRLPAPPELIKNVALDLRDKFGSNQALIVIDSLQVWARGAARSAESGLNGDEYSLINSALSSVVSIASIANCPVIVIAHRNRAGNKTDGGLHAAKGSGSIEYEAESVLDLNREAEASNASGEIEVTAKLHKNRNGAAGVSVKLAFHGALQTFREV